MGAGVGVGVGEGVEEGVEVGVGVDAMVSPKYIESTKTGNSYIPFASWITIPFILVFAPFKSERGIVYFLYMFTPG